MEEDTLLHLLDFTWTYPHMFVHLSTQTCAHARAQTHANIKCTLSNCYVGSKEHKNYLELAITWSKRTVVRQEFHPSFSMREQATT